MQNSGKPMHRRFLCSRCPALRRLRREARTNAQDLRLHAIYGVGEQVTVDVSVGNGPSFPLTKGRRIEGWSLASIAPASVTFKHVNGRKKTVYLSTPAQVDAEA